MEGLLLMQKCVVFGLWPPSLGIPAKVYTLTCCFIHILFPPSGQYGENTRPEYSGILAHQEAPPYYGLVPPPPAGGVQSPAPQSSVGGWTRLGRSNFFFFLID